MTERGQLEFKYRRDTLLSRWGGVLYNLMGLVAYHIVRVISYPILKLFFRLEVRNPGRIPREGPIILAANHHSLIDPWVLQVAFPRRITYMVAALFYEGKGHWFYRMHQSIPVKERGLNKDAFASSLRVLRNKGVIAIFPEGWGNGNGRSWRGSPGVAMLSYKSHVPVLPAYISGAQDALPRGAKFPRFAKIRVTFGEPIPFDGAEKPDKETLRKMTDLVMEKIKELA